MGLPLLPDLDLDPDFALSQLESALSGADDGELYLEHTKAQTLVYDDGRLKRASYDEDRGFGLRSVAGELTGYAHSDQVTEASLARAGEMAAAAARSGGGTLALDPKRTNQRPYTDEDVIDAGPSFEKQVALAQTIDAHARAKDPRVRQVTVSLSTAHKDVTVLRPGGFRVSDSRPMSSMRVSVMLQDGDKREAGGFALGGRTALDPHIGELAWEEAVAQAIRQAEVNLQAVEAPAGEMTVVCGPGWPGVLLHEAVGHGLEGDFNRKQTSLYAGMMGEMVAAPGVTIIDDGTLTDHRGSLAIDDEGTPTQSNVLIENGRLVGYMQDRMNARLMGVAATGNGRRESYAHAPMPRMTNTFMAAGQDDPGEIIASVKDGIYAVDFGGGQVDITNGQFTFKITEAYRIRDGQIAEPIKGVTLIGNGPEVMRRVSMVGNDLAIKKGVGMCGKAGQSLPVTVGQPTCKIDAITVGGTQV